MRSSTRLEAQGVAVLLAGMRAPPNLGRAYGDAFEAVFPRLAERYGVPLYPFFLEAWPARRAQPARWHPSHRRGIEIIVERILPTVTDWLERTG